MRFIAIFLCLGVFNFYAVVELSRATENSNPEGQAGRGSTSKQDRARTVAKRLNRSPGSWIPKPAALEETSLSQGEQMLNDMKRPEIPPAKSQARTHFIGACQTPKGAYYASQQDPRNFERCLDEPGRQVGAAALIALPN